MANLGRPTRGPRRPSPPMPGWCRKRDQAGAPGGPLLAGVPAAKRARAARPPEVEKELYDVQLELTLLDERCAEEQIKVQRRYDKERERHFAVRSARLRGKPAFWKAALCGHPASLVHPAEREALEHITDLQLQDNMDSSGSFAVKIDFAAGGPFRESSARKKVVFGEEMSVRVEAATLTAAGESGREVLGAVRGGASGSGAPAPSVLGWMTSETAGAVGLPSWSDGSTPSAPSAAQGAEDFGEVLRRDLWQDPLPYFLKYHREHSQASEAGDANPEPAAHSHGEQPP